MLEEPLLLLGSISRPDRQEQVREVFEQVGLGQELADPYSHEVSGGQCPRDKIARAILTRPKLMVLDEPTSALDVSLRPVRIGSGRALRCAAICRVDRVP